jgi:hypothetical protein
VLRSLTASLLFAAACGTSPVVDDLAGESAADDQVDAKSDSPFAAGYTYYAITADLRKCASPYCGGYFVSRVNRTSTRCKDGSYHAACYTPTLDWTRTQLDETLQQKLVDAANQTDGTYALVRGYFSAGPTSLGQFSVDEAWVAEGASAPDGVFVKVKDNGIRCITAPCPSLGEQALNTTRTANLSDLDFSVSGLSDREVQGVQDDFYTGHGSLLAGDRYYDNHAKGRTVTNAFHLLVAPTPP